MTPAEKNAFRQQELEGRARSAGIEYTSLPALERWITPDEYARVLAPCLQSKGFDATVTPDGVLESNVPDAQASAHERAKLECEAMYAIDPRFQTMEADAALTVLWEYYDSFAIPCLRRHGVEPLEPLPTREAFVQGAPWRGRPSENLPRAQRELLATECPSGPPAAAFGG